MNKGFVTRRSFLLGLAGLGTALSLPNSWAQDTQFQPFSFAYVTGSYLANGIPDSYKLTQESQLFLQDAVKQITAFGVDFVIFGGDQVASIGEDEKNWQLFIDIVQILDCPWQFVLGESDVSGIIPVEKLPTFGRDWKGKGLPGDKSYWSLDLLSNVHLIGLDTSKANSTEGYVSSEQLQWLKDDLAKAKGRLTIVVSHHPLLAPAPYDSGPPWDQYLLPQGANVREVLNMSPDVRLSLSGHVHVTKIERERNIWYVSSPSLAVYPCAFRIFSVNAECINVGTYGVNYPSLLKKARTNMISSRMAFDYDNAKPARFLDIAYGDKIDNDASLPLSSSKDKQPFKAEKVPNNKDKKKAAADKSHQ